jgi:succinate dehydrogenase/fumarate reductase flavoprotein subunit
VNVRDRNVSEGTVRHAELKQMKADVLVIGGGPAATWAALTAAEAGASVIVVDKGYVGTSGATAPANTGTWSPPPGERRQAAIAARQPRTGNLADPDWVERTLDTAWRKLHCLAEWGYRFPLDDDGNLYRANLRGPDYMHFMRRRVLRAGAKIFDHHPALELVGDVGGVVGASGVDRQRGRPWQISASAVVLATGGCAFGERMLGAAALTGDGYLMAAEAGAVLSGMEFSSQYATAPKPSALNKGLPFAWASFFREDGRRLETEGKDRYTVVAAALLEGSVYAQYDKAWPELQQWLRQGQPNCFLPLDRSGVDPFAERWPVTLRCEGTVRGVGGIRLTGDDCSTGVPGLYAAGDAASRERLTGAISGGGGPNSSWAIASGNWAGRAAAEYARQTGGFSDGPIVGLGRAGLRPSAEVREDVTASELAQVVRQEMLPLDRNYFRRADNLEASLDRLDASWEALSGHLCATGVEAVKLREAAALIATSRWAYRSALARAESRGMHRRTDRPVTDRGFECLFEISGVDTVRIERRALDWSAAA